MLFVWQLTQHNASSLSARMSFTVIAPMPDPAFRQNRYEPAVGDKVAIHLDVSATV